MLEMLRDAQGPSGTLTESGMFGYSTLRSTQERVGTHGEAFGSFNSVQLQFWMLHGGLRRQYFRCLTLRFWNQLDFI